MIAPALRGPEALESALARVLSSGVREALTVELPAPVGAAHRLFDGPEGEASYYEAHGDLLLVGLGVAREARAAGSERFDQVRATLSPELERLGPRRGPSPLRGRPVALGGFAFEATLKEGSAWAPFGAARMVIPRWLYRVDGGSATLSRIVEAGDGPEEVLAEYEGLLDRLTAREETGTVRAERIDLGTAKAMAEKVATARSLIRDRVFDKVVLAESRRYRLSAGTRLGDVLEHLGSPESGAVRFGFRVGAQAFVGSTPERLVAKRGRRVETEAVAGSVVWDGISTERDLLASQKDLDEQGFVVRFIREALSSLGSQVALSATPHIRRLTHVGHLVTRLQAEVDPGLHILEVGRRLHPTPAVAGTPTQAALEHIADHEGFERGWYAGAIGWFDAEGDGELRVALRSGRIDGEVVHIFAGAGIVADSVPSRELAEIESKQRRMMGAIGAVV